jgi:DsbC/DsbD-like thiol-disulfide interchange protein
LQADAGRDMTAPMLKTAFSIAALAAASVFAQPALASSSDWHGAQGGRVRLLTSGAPDEHGVLRGALEIDLEPGWKTYWLDPGDAGVPPSLDVSGSRNVATAEMQFPAPHRFDDGYAKWAGYKGPVTFAVNFKLADRSGPTAIDAKVFLGICQTICVPLQARLHVDAASDPDNADDAATVQAAFDSLPGPEQPDFGVTLVGGSKDEVVVEAAYPGEPNAVDFFLAGSAGYLFGPPERRLNGEQLVFSVPILERPDKAPDSGGLPYTLVSAGGAVSGVLPYPPAP